MLEYVGIINRFFNSFDYCIFCFLALMKMAIMTNLDFRFWLLNKLEEQRDKLEEQQEKLELERKQQEVHSKEGIDEESNK